jgi:hypothetical protein
MNKNIFSASLILLSIAALGACSIKTSGGAPPAADNGGFFDQKATVPGPAVEGEWTSLCARKYQDTYRIFNFKFKGDTVARNEVLFSDAKCKVKAGEKFNHGRFRFIDAFADGGFGIEYAFDLGSGLTTFPQEKLAVDGTALYISDFQTGEMARVNEKEPLYLAGTTPPAPTPAPTPAPGSPTKAILANDYQGAKYAFCNTQGRAVIVDFQGASLATDGQGLAKIGTRSCGSKSPIQWRSTATSFTVSVVNGFPIISFNSGSRDYPDNIRSYYNYQGLSGSIETFARFDGNSGGCFFTTNGGTQGIPFMDACE